MGEEWEETRTKKEESAGCFIDQSEYNNYYVQQQVNSSALIYNRTTSHRSLFLTLSEASPAERSPESQCKHRRTSADKKIKGIRYDHCCLACSRSIGFGSELAQRGSRTIPSGLGMGLVLNEKEERGRVSTRLRRETRKVFTHSGPIASLELSPAC